MKTGNFLQAGMAMLLMLAFGIMGCSNPTSLEKEPLPDPAAPTISSQPEEWLGTIAENATLTVTAGVTDGGTLTYQWYKSATSDGEGTAVSGAVNLSYTFASSEAGTAYYYVVITNSLNGTTAPVTSNRVRVVFSDPAANPVDPIIITQPKKDTLYTVGAVAQPLTVVVTAQDEGEITYQWYSNAADSNTGGDPISEAETSSYTPSTGNTGTVYYYVIVTNTKNMETASVTSETGKVVVYNSEAGPAAPGITGHPQNAGYSLGDQAAPLMVTVSPNDDGYITYRWYKNITDSTEGAEVITGAVTLSYTPSTAAAGTVYYYVVITNTKNATQITVTSDLAKIEVFPLPMVPQITGQPQSKGYTLEVPAEALTVTASVDDGGNLTYQWYRNTTGNNTTGTPIEEEVAENYTPLTTTAGTVYYYVVVTNTINGKTASAPSQIAAILVSDEPVVDAADPAITVQPATESNGYAKTDTISLSVTAEITDGDSGGVLSYQWFSNALNNTSTGTELAEAVTGSLSIPAYSFIGDRYYYVKVTNTNETVNGVKTKTVTSNVVLVKVNPSVADARLKLLYKDFIPSAGDAAKILDESGNGFTGALEGSAAADTSAKVMTTGSGSGYLDMGAAAGAMVGNLEDYTISTYIYVGAENALNSWGNFVWLFAGADSLAEAKGGIYFDAHRTRAAIQQVGATMESAVTTKDDDTNKQAIEKGIWKHFTYRQSGNTGNLYMDGKLIVTAPVTVKPKDYTNPLTVNVLGKPGYGGDSYLNYAKYRDFRIYNAPLEAGEILALAGELDTLNTSEATQIKNSVDTYVGTLSDGASPAGNLTAVAGNLALPIFVYNSNGHIAISWATSDPAVITTTGVVTRPPNGESDATLTLTASFTKGSYTATKVFNVTVKAAPPDLNQYLKLRYEVNAAGNGFENVAPTDGNTYTPQHYLGSFETVNGLKVYNTGGTVDNAKGKTEGGADTPEGQGDLCPWAAGYYWDHYENIGYVDLGAQSGELLRTLGEFSIETYLYLPANAQTDRVGQYVWAFADQVAPANAVWFNYREFTFVIKIAEEDTAVGSDWNNASPKHGKGAWHHLLVTKNSSTAAVYLDGEQVLTGASTVLTTAFTAGTLDTNYLGKPCYAPGVWDQGLFDTKFHSFSIFNKAMTADEAAYLTSSGPLATLRN